MIKDVSHYVFQHTDKPPINIKLIYSQYSLQYSIIIDNLNNKFHASIISILLLDMNITRLNAIITFNQYIRHTSYDTLNNIITSELRHYLYNNTKLIYHDTFDYNNTTLKINIIYYSHLKTYSLIFYNNKSFLFFTDFKEIYNDEDAIEYYFTHKDNFFHTSKLI